MIRKNAHALIGVFVLYTIFGLAISQCAKAPPTLSPAGQADWNTIQIGQDFDLVRDIVHAGATQTTPVFTRDVDVKVATWHKAAVQTLAARGAGWQTTLKTGFKGLTDSLSDADRQRLLPYITLVNSVLATL